MAEDARHPMSGDARGVRGPVPAGRSPGGTAPGDHLAWRAGHAAAARAAARPHRDQTLAKTVYNVIES